VAQLGQVTRGGSFDLTNSTTQSAIFNSASKQEGVSDGHMTQTLPVLCSPELQEEKQGDLTSSVEDCTQETQEENMPNFLRKLYFLKDLAMNIPENLKALKCSDDKNTEEISRKNEYFAKNSTENSNDNPHSNLRSSTKIKATTPTTETRRQRKARNTPRLTPSLLTLVAILAICGNAFSTVVVPITIGSQPCPAGSKQLVNLVSDTCQDPSSNSTAGPHDFFNTACTTILDSFADGDHMYLVA
jgi:hypothetical protein